MILFDEDDTQIIERDGKHFMRYDAGGFVAKYEEIEISKEDAERVMQDVMYSLQVVWNYKNRQRGLI